MYAYLGIEWVTVNIIVYMHYLVHIMCICICGCMYMHLSEQELFQLSMGKSLVLCLSLAATWLSKDEEQSLWVIFIVHIIKVFHMIVYLLFVAHFDFDHCFLIWSTTVFLQCLKETCKRECHFLWLACTMYTLEWHTAYPRHFSYKCLFVCFHT